jgi:hypothetical protein
MTGKSDPFNLHKTCILEISSTHTTTKTVPVDITGKKSMQVEEGSIRYALISLFNYLKISTCMLLIILKYPK